MGPPKFSTLLFLHARRSDPDRPSGISPSRDLRTMFVFSVGCLVSRQCHMISSIITSSRFLCIGFQDVNTVAVCIYAFDEAEIASGRCVRPSGLQDSLCTLHLFVHDRSSVHTSTPLSVTDATLDTGGWLTLTRLGLAPGKKRQASLGALTFWRCAICYAFFIRALISSTVYGGFF